MTKKKAPANPGDELRKRAEKIAKGKNSRMPENVEALSPEELRRTLHQLQVHQIELEMQNEELRLVQEALELSRNTYAELYMTSRPVGYFTIDAQGLIEGVNLKGAHLLGIKRGLLLKRPFISFIAEAADRGDFFETLRSRFSKTAQPDL